MSFMKFCASKTACHFNGVDMSEATIVPEIGDETISYNKGCYIGQEIIARIHFRGHVAKRLTGLILSEPSALAGGVKRATAKRRTKIARRQKCGQDNFRRVFAETWQNNRARLRSIRLSGGRHGTESRRNGGNRQTVTVH